MVIAGLVCDIFTHGGFGDFLVAARLILPATYCVLAFITIDSQGPKAMDLPQELLLDVFSYLGIGDTCQLYLNLRVSQLLLEKRYHGDEVPTDVEQQLRSVSRLMGSIAGYLQTQRIKVSIEKVPNGDNIKISTKHYAGLPPCNIEVKTPLSELDLTKDYLQNVKYTLLALHVMHKFYIEFVPTDLGGLKGNVTEMKIEGNMLIDPKDIPLTVTRLELNCPVKLPQNFDHLTNLTYVRFWTVPDQLTLPQLVTTILMSSDSGLPPYDASVLTNLKLVEGDGFVNPRWSQLETIRCPLPSDCHHLNLLKEIEIVDDYKSFKDIECPQLTKVIWSESPTKNCNITDVFTNEQLGNLLFIKGYIVPLDSLHLLSLVTVLHTKVDVTIDELFPLPPRVVDFAVILSQSVVGIPSQLKRFKYSGASEDQPSSDVQIVSTLVRKVDIIHVRNLIMDCPKLTDLQLLKVDLVVKLDAPNLVKLIMGLADVPVETFPRLGHLVIMGVLIREPAKDLIVNHHLKFVRVLGENLGKVDISADCALFQSCRTLDETPRISSRILWIDDILYTADGKSIKTPSHMEVVISGQWWRDNLYKDYCPDFETDNEEDEF